MLLIALILGYILGISNYQFTLICLLLTFVNSQYSAFKNCVLVDCNFNLILVGVNYTQFIYEHPIVF